MMYLSFVRRMRLFINTLVLTRPNRMVLLSTNTHILDVARTMMIHMHVLKYLWADVVLSACHLINRIPSSFLHCKNPFSCLYPNKSVYSVALCVFGCTCFVQDLSSVLN